MSCTFQHSKLIKLEFLADDVQLKSPQDSLSKEVSNELACYLKNPKHSFRIAFHLQGTPFQQVVWQALQRIPSGGTRTYGALAKQLNTSARAIGNACRMNPIPIIIPCHRVIAANHLGGYAGQQDGTMMDIKKWLLQHEKVSTFLNAHHVKLK